MTNYDFLDGVIKLIENTADKKTLSLIKDIMDKEKKYKTECAFYNSDGENRYCSALRQLYCLNNKACNFFQTREDFDVIQKKYPYQTLELDTRNKIKINSDYIRVLFKNKKMTQTEFSCRCGVELRTMSRVLNNEETSKRLLSAMAKVLETDEEKLKA